MFASFARPTRKERNRSPFAEGAGLSAILASLLSHPDLSRNSFHTRVS